MWCVLEASDAGLLIPLLFEALVSGIHYICARKLIFET